MDRFPTPSALRLVLAIEASPRLRALLSGVGYTPRDHRFGWKLVARARRGSAAQRLMLRAFVHAWSPTALRLIETHAGVCRRPMQPTPMVAPGTASLPSLGP